MPSIRSNKVCIDGGHGLDNCNEREISYFLLQSQLPYCPAVDPRAENSMLRIKKKSSGTELVMYILFCTSLHIYCTYIQFKRRWKAHKAIGLLYPLSGTKQKVRVWRVYKSLKHTK